MKGMFQLKFDHTDWIDIPEPEMRHVLSGHYSPKSAVDDALDEMIYDGRIFQFLFAKYRFKKEGG